MQQKSLTRAHCATNVLVHSDPGVVVVANFFQHLHCFYQFLLMFSIFTTNFIASTPLLRIFYSWSKHKRIRTVRQYTGSLGLAHPRGMYYNGKEGREEPLLITSYNMGWACHISISSASCRARHKSYALWLATCYKRWLRAHTTQLSSDRFNFRIGQTSWSGQQHTNVLASLRPVYITQLLGVSRQIIRHLGVSRLMYARH